MKRREVSWVGDKFARVSLRWANAWLKLCGSKIRYYSSLRLFVNGVEFKEVKNVSFERTEKKPK